MKSILTIITTFFIIISISSSVPVWKKHAFLIDTLSKENLQYISFKSNSEWFFIKKDTLQNYFGYLRLSDGSSIDITDRLKENLTGKWLNNSYFFLIENNSIISISNGNDGDKIFSVSNDNAKSWFEFELNDIPNSILKKKDDFYILHDRYNFDATYPTDRILKYNFVNNELISDEIFVTENNNDLSSLYDLDENNDLFISLLSRQEPYIYYRPQIYNSDNIFISEFDFESDYFPFDYSPTSNESHIISDIKNIKDNIWIMRMLHNGYFLTYDNGKKWEFYEIDHSKYRFYSFHSFESKDYYLSIGFGLPKYTNDLSDIGLKIMVLDENNNLVFPDDIISGVIDILEDNAFAIGKDGWIYSLTDVEITSVEDYGIESIDIELNPSPVNEILHLRTNSDILIESLTIYDLLGNKLIQQAVNSSDNNFKINCSTLAAGTYMIVAQTKNGNITNKFIKW
jgi:type IX secretion system substrate protein